ncbi:MAG: hydrolase 2, exosortase A system-associated [Steroidobacteraceae bacterium]
MSVAFRSAQGDLCCEFVPSDRGPLFVMLHLPRAQVRDCVLVVPPFAEEMNKSRRLVAELAAALVKRGLNVAIPDLSGTGDSAGDFGDASWIAWLDDLALCREWTESRGLTVSSLLAIRLGAALACDAVSTGKLPPVRRTTFCQPVLDGRRHLQQFLRLRVAAKMVSRDGGESIDSLRGLLSSGVAVEVAGYSVAPVLAQELEAISAPDQLPQAFGEVDWVEVVRSLEAGPSAQAIRLSERSGTGGAAIRTHAVVGEPFWGATEIVVDRNLLAVLEGCLAADSASTGNRPH